MRNSQHSPVSKMPSQKNKVCSNARYGYDEDEDAEAVLCEDTISTPVWKIIVENRKLC